MDQKRAREDIFDFELLFFFFFFLFFKVLQQNGSEQTEEHNVSHDCEREEVADDDVDHVALLGPYVVVHVRVPVFAEHLAEDRGQRVPDVVEI